MRYAQASNLFLSTTNINEENKVNYVEKIISNEQWAPSIYKMALRLRVINVKGTEGYEWMPGGEHEPVSHTHKNRSHLFVVLTYTSSILSA